MSAKEIKRVTLEITEVQHRKLRAASKLFDITQQDLLGLIVDLTLTNPDTIRKPVETFVRKKREDEARARELEDKTKSLISSLTPEQLSRLLSGDVDLSKL